MGCKGQEENGMTLVATFRKYEMALKAMFLYSVNNLLLDFHFV